MKKKQESILDLIRGAHDAWSGMSIALKTNLTMEKNGRFGGGIASLCSRFKKLGIILATWFTLTVLRLGVRAVGGADVRCDGRSDRHWSNLAD